MPYRTKTFKLLPWIGGVNTSLDPAVIPPNQLTKAEELLFGVRGSRMMREGINYNWDNASNGTDDVIAGLDFWYGSTSRTNVKLGLADNKTLYQWSTAGARTTPAELALSCSFTNASPTVGTCANHGFTQNEPVVFSGGSLPTGITAGTMYYVLTLGTTNTFSLSTTPFPATTPVNTSSTGNGTAIPVAWGSAITTASFETLNNVAVYGADGASNRPRKYDGTTVRMLGGNAPLFTIVRKHLGRLWANDKTNPDRLHYSTTANPDQWSGVGDSGAIDIGVGDGDPVGITAIFPTFQGVLYVAKQTKLYRVRGLAPEEFVIELVSDGIGCISHNSICAVDQDDILFISPKGVHSLIGTIQAGDVESRYLSADIQGTFNDHWVVSRRKFAWGAYLAEENVVAFAVSDDNYDSSASTNNCIWFYNVPLKSWFCWPNVTAQCLFVGKDTDRQRFYLGGVNNRLAKSFDGNTYDTTASGGTSAIEMVVKTGVIYLSENPNVICGFKKLTLYYKPEGTHQITASIKIDNYSAQDRTFEQTQTGGVLGVSFYLGQTALGYDFVMGPYTQEIDGYGRAFQLTITQSGDEAPIEIQGFGIEFEEMGPAQETVTTG